MTERKADRTSVADLEGQSRGRDYQPTAIYILAEKLRQRGVRLWGLKGPWRAIKRPLSHGPSDAEAVPVVTNGRNEVMVDTMEHAADVSGFLNWAGVDDLTPVPELTPPAAAPA
jgi:hypothetical protein